MFTTKQREIKREYRHSRIRKKIFGTSERLRLYVHRSHKNFFAQVIDDVQGKVLFGMSTLDQTFRSKSKKGGNLDAASAFGESFANAAIKKGFKKVSFDRGGYLYHGRVKAFAEAARKAGLEF